MRVSALAYVGVCFRSVRPRPPPSPAVPFLSNVRRCKKKTSCCAAPEAWETDAVNRLATCFVHPPLLFDACARALWPSLPVVPCLFSGCHHRLCLDTTPLSPPLVCLPQLLGHHQTLRCLYHHHHYRRLSFACIPTRRCLRGSLHFRAVKKHCSGLAHPGFQNGTCFVCVGLKD